MTNNPGPTAINSKVHPKDEMLHDLNIKHYLKCGEQVADMVAIAMELGASEQSLLELPCGFGRATRHLVRRFPNTKICVADIQAEAVRFCEAEFGVSGKVISAAPAEKFEFRNIEDQGFSVACMGSLITHLNEENSRQCLLHFFKKVRPAGIAVVTAHGERSYELLKQQNIYDISESDRTKLLAVYEQGGFGYVNYQRGHTFEKNTAQAAGASEYGISLAASDSLRRMFQSLGMEVLRHTAGFWDNHQDVWWLKRL